MADERHTYEIGMADGGTKILEIPAAWKWTLGPISPTRRQEGSKYNPENNTKGWMLRVYADAGKKDQRVAQGEVLSVRQLSKDVVFRDKVPAETTTMDPDEEGEDALAGVF